MAIFPSVFSLPPLPTPGLDFNSHQSDHLLSRFLYNESILYNSPDPRSSCLHIAALLSFHYSLLFTCLCITTARTYGQCYKQTGAFSHNTLIIFLSSPQSPIQLLYIHTASCHVRLRGTELDQPPSNLDCASPTSSSHHLGSKQSGLKHTHVYLASTLFGLVTMPVCFPRGHFHTRG